MARGLVNSKVSKLLLAAKGADLGVWPQQEGRAHEGAGWPGGAAAGGRQPEVGQSSLPAVDAACSCAPQEGEREAVSGSQAPLDGCRGAEHVLGQLCEHG